MRNNGQRWMISTTVPPTSERKPETVDQWYSFLEDECQKDNGLLCFYDRHKSREVAYFCGLLANCLTSSAGASEDRDLGKLFDVGPMSDRGRVPASR